MLPAELHNLFAFWLSQDFWMESSSLWKKVINTDIKQV